MTYINVTLLLLSVDLCSKYAYHHKHMDIDDFYQFG